MVFCFFLRDQSFRFEGSHTAYDSGAENSRFEFDCSKTSRLTRSSTGNGLTILLVLHISRGKHTLNARLRSPGNSYDVAVLIGVDLIANE